jgi:HD-like signal output (HDOD) protein
MQQCSKRSGFLRYSRKRNALLITTDIARRLLTRLPAFSPVAVRLLAVLADDRMSYKDAAGLIALDPVLAAEILRLANSGFYGRRCQVSSVQSAIAILGIGTVSRIAVTAALWRGLPRRTEPFVRDWWRHSIAAAFIARHSSQAFSRDIAYTAALLHGVGQLAFFQDAPHDYSKLVERVCIDGLDLLECERDALGVDHASLAGRFLEAWGLPKTLCSAVASHHETDGTDLMLAVQIGCLGAERAGFGQCGCHNLLSTSTPEQLAKMSADDRILDAVLVEVNQIECCLV